VLIFSKSAVDAKKNKNTSFVCLFNTRVHIERIVKIGGYSMDVCTVAYLRRGHGAMPPPLVRQHKFL